MQKISCSITPFGHCVTDESWLSSSGMIAEASAQQLSVGHPLCYISMGKECHVVATFSATFYHVYFFPFVLYLYSCIQGGYYLANEKGAKYW
jgi:hypothetical protein